MIADLVRYAIRSAVFGTAGGGGGIGGNILSGIGNFLGGGKTPSYNGNAFTGPIRPHKNGGVMSQPFTFDMGNGKMGSGAEAGAEAIMPLQRDKNGRLGVVSAGGSSAGSVNNININTTINPSPNQTAADTRKMAADFNRSVEAKIMQTMAKMQNTGVGGRKSY
jgi:phage-related minor tail protein